MIQLAFAAFPQGHHVTGLQRTASAAWPVWRDSTTAEVKFAPLPRKKAAKLYHEARRFERMTREKGKQDGALGRNGLKVLETLIFDFLNFVSGRLDPSIESIAAKAGIGKRSASRGLAALKEHGLLNWVRRCAKDWEGGRFVLRQLSNAYAILPVSQWFGYVPAPEPSAPYPEAWGAVPPLPSCLEEASGATGHAARIRALALDPRDDLAAALARLGACLPKAANP